MSDVIIYDKEYEELFLQFLVSDSELFVRALTILDPENFHDYNNKEVVKFLIDYAKSYSTVPPTDIIYAATKVKLDTLDKNTLVKNEGWFLKTFESFSRHRALERAILTSPELLEEGRYGEVEKLIKDAVQIGLVRDLGTDYFSEPLKRLKEIAESSGSISTGWRDIDHKLYGGLNRGEITIFAGQSGTGKSLFLQNLARNWAEIGLHVVYISLELSENLCAMRIDSMISGIETRNILKNAKDVALKVATFGKKTTGSLRIKQLPSGCTANDIMSYIKEYEVQSGIKVDAILIDYLDLMMPISKRVSPSDLFVKDKYVSEELRNLAIELDTLMVSASQLNRQSYDELEFDPSHISGGISKINTADNVLGIFTTPSMREAGRYQIQFLKTRSSSGVGSRVDLAFDPKSLLIYDLDEGDEDSITAQTTNIMDTLKKKSVVSNGTNQSSNKQHDVSKKTADLRDMLKRLE